MFGSVIVLIPSIRLRFNSVTFSMNHPHQHVRTIWAVVVVGDSGRHRLLQLGIEVIANPNRLAASTPHGRHQRGNDRPAGNGAVDVSKITRLHGHLHETQRGIETDVLPLGHMRTQFDGAQLPKQASMDRLADGLEAWRSGSSGWGFGR